MVGDAEPTNCLHTFIFFGQPNVCALFYCAFIFFLPSHWSGYKITPELDKVCEIRENKS